MTQMNRSYYLSDITFVLSKRSFKVSVERCRICKLILIVVFAEVSVRFVVYEEKFDLI